MKKIIIPIVGATSLVNAAVLSSYDFEDVVSGGTDTTYVNTIRGYWYDGGVQVSTASDRYGYGELVNLDAASITGDGRGLDINSASGISETLNTSDGLYFRFGFQILGLGDGETIDLESITFDLGAQNRWSAMAVGLYTDNYGQTLYDSAALGYTIDNGSSSNILSLIHI